MNLVAVAAAAVASVVNQNPRTSLTNFQRKEKGRTKGTMRTIRGIVCSFVIEMYDKLE